MIKRKLTNSYLSSFDLLTEALYSCWSNSFCYETNTLDKRKLKEQIRSYGFYDHKYAVRKEIPINFINNFEFKTLVWVNRFLNAANQDELCEYVELYKQVIDEIENNLFLLKNRDERIAYANILLHNFDKGHIHRRRLDISERNRLYKETFEIILDRKFLSEDSAAIQDDKCFRRYPNYDLTARLINHLDFIDNLIELFLCFDINLVSLAQKIKCNLYIFSDNEEEEEEGLNYDELNRLSNNVYYDNEKCKSCNNFYCNRLHYNKKDQFTNQEHKFNDNIYDLEIDVIPKFNSALSDECLIKIMNYLSKNKKLDYPNIDVWLFWFNRKYIKVPVPLKWKGTSSMLSNVIQQLCGESISNTIKTAFCTKEYTKPTRKEYESGKTYKEIEQIITISKQKSG